MTETFRKSSSRGLNAAYPSFCYGQSGLGYENAGDARRANEHRPGARARMFTRLKLLNGHFIPLSIPSRRLPFPICNEIWTKTRWFGIWPQPGPTHYLDTRPAAVDRC